MATLIYDANRLDRQKMATKNKGGRGSAERERKPTPTELTVENTRLKEQINHLEGGCWITSVSKVLNSLVLMGFPTLAIYALAGKTTSLTVQTGLSTLQWLAISASIAIGVGGVVFGIQERRFRYEKTADLTQRIKDLELMLDSRRESSNLPPSGQTPRGQVA